MKKRSPLALAIIIALAFSLPSANGATAKAGASCPKMKAVSIVKGKKFTCIKSGKKLIWNKGVIVKVTPKPVVLKCPELTADDSQGIAKVRADSLIGMSEMQGQQCAESINWGFRIGQRDDELFALTRDYRLDRVTVIVKLGVITQVDVG